MHGPHNGLTLRGSPTPHERQIVVVEHLLGIHEREVMVQAEGDDRVACDSRMQRGHPGDFKQGLRFVRVEAEGKRKPKYRIA